MILTSEQVIKRIAATYNTTVGLLSITYYANEKFRTEMDSWLNPINDRREENGFDRVVFSKKYFENFIQLLAEQK